MEKHEAAIWMNLQERSRKSGYQENGPAECSGPIVSAGKTSRGRPERRTPVKHRGAVTPDKNNQTPRLIYVLHTCADLSVLDTKATPIACGDTHERTRVGIVLQSVRPSDVKLLRTTGGVRSSDPRRREYTCITMKLTNDVGCTVLLFDRTHAFNSMFHCAPCQS